MDTLYKIVSIYWSIIGSLDQTSCWFPRSWGRSIKFIMIHHEFKSTYFTSISSICPSRSISCLLSTLTLSSNTCLSFSKLFESVSFRLWTNYKFKLNEKDDKFLESNHLEELQKSIITFLLRLGCALLWNEMTFSVDYFFPLALQFFKIKKLKGNIICKIRENL